MTWQSNTITAAELANFNADKPCILPWGIVPTSAKWTAAGGAGDADITDSAAPAAYAYDAYTHQLTRPASSGVDRYFNFMLPEGTAYAFNAITIIGHNLSGKTVEFWLGDNDAFGTGPGIVESWTPSDNSRITSLDLRHTGSTPREYWHTTGTGRARVRVTSGGAFTPEIAILAGISR